MSCTTKFIKTFKQYELSWREQASKQDTHYRDSDTYQGVKSCNQQGKENTTGVREHPGLQGVRDYTDQANTRDCNWSPVCSPGPTHPSPDMYPDRSTMDSSDEVGHSSNSSRALLQPRFCRQDQPVPIELESLDQQHLGSRDNDEGISHPSHIQSGSTCTASYPRLPTKGHANSPGRRGQITLAEAAIQHLPRVSSGLYSNMFMVPKKGVGQRPIINLKYLNKFVKSEHFKMEGLHTVKALLQKNDWMTKIDLKDAFFMVPIAPQFHKFLLFSVGMQTYQFRCLPFGLCTVPRVFTKVLKPVVERLRSIGIRLVIYIDDMLLQHITHRASICNPVSSREHRVSDQQQEISVTAKPRNRISWNDNRFSENGLETSRRKDQEHQTGGTEFTQSLQPLSSLPIPTSWQAKCNHPSTSDGSCILLPSPYLLETSPGSQLARLQVPYSAISPGSRGPLVVGTSPIHMERQEPDCAASHHDINFRCFTSRVGSYVPATEYRPEVHGLHRSNHFISIVWSFWQPR